MKTTVEWLEHMLLIILNEEEFKKITYAIEQAKEMEKQQIIVSYCQGCYDITKDNSIFPREKSEDYYNQTFNK